MIKANSNNFTQIAKVGFGRVGYIYASIVLTLDMFFGAAMNILLVTKCFNLLYPDFEMKLIKLVTVTLLIPFTWFESLGVLSYTSFLGTFAICLSLVVLVYDGLSTTVSPGSLINTAETAFLPNSLFEFPLAFGLLYSTFVCHVVAATIYHEMKNKSHYKRMIIGTLSYVVTFTLVFATIGYLMYGDDVPAAKSEENEADIHASDDVEEASLNSAITTMTRFNDCYLGDKCEYSHDMSRDNTPAKADDGYPNKGENNKKFIKKRKYEDYQGGYEHSDAKVKKYNNISVEYNAATTNNQNNKSSFHEESKILFDTLSSNKNNVISEADVNYNDKINESTMQFLSYIKKKVDYENGNNLDNLNKLNVKFLNLQQENENLKNLILLNHAEMLKKLNNEKNLLTTDLGIDTNDSQFSSFEEKLSAIEKIKLPFTQLVDKVFQLE
ncbi:hypothetical protein HK099_005986, partial [Clydaea vesicula]